MSGYVRTMSEPDFEIARRLNGICTGLQTIARSGVSLVETPSRAGCADMRKALVGALAEIDRLEKVKEPSAAMQTSIERLRNLAASRKRGPVGLGLHTPNDESVRLIANPAPTTSAVRSAIEYARGLGKASRAGKSSGIPLYSSEGKALFDRTLQQVREFDRIMRQVRSSDSERREVVRRLEVLPGSGVVKLVRAAPIRLGTVQKFMSGSTRMVRGYATTGNLDRVGDIVVPSGMKASLPVSLLWNHNSNYPIGSVAKADVRSEGVWIEGSLVTGTQQADDAWNLIEQDAVTSFSIGFLPLKSEPLSNGGIRFTSWELTEVSVVSVPANVAAKIRRSV